MMSPSSNSQQWRIDAFCRENVTFLKIYFIREIAAKTLA